MLSESRAADSCRAVYIENFSRRWNYYALSFHSFAIRLVMNELNGTLDNMRKRYMVI